MSAVEARVQVQVRARARARVRVQGRARALAWVQARDPVPPRQACSQTAVQSRLRTHRAARSKQT